MGINCDGKTALITGASAGIGVEFAKQLAAKGCNLILVARRKDRLEQLAEQIRNEYKRAVHVIDVDLSKAEAVDQIQAFVAEQKLSVEILVNNAGFGTYGKFVEQSAKREWDEIAVNISSLVSLCHAFLPPMIEKKSGVIINLASIAAFQPVAYMAVYAATKAFVLSFTEALWAESRSNGVRVYAVCPGPVATEFQEVAQSKIPVGSMESAQHCVQVALNAMDEHESHVVTGGISNFLLTKLGRITTRSFAAQTSAIMMKPSK